MKTLPLPLTSCPFLRSFFLWMLAGCLAIPAAPRNLDSLPQPEPGQWATTTLALLHYNRDLCDTIAGRVQQRWRSLDGSGSEQQIRDYVLQSSLSDLAAARAADDIVDRFLSRARQEADRETAGSLTRLTELSSALCDAVALPTAPRRDFDLKIRDLLTRIDREKTELGRLLVTTEADLERALEPYLVPIQLAGVEAEGQYLDYLESIRPKPEPPSMQVRMEAWHRGYATRTATVKTALGKFLAARQTSDSQAIREACREISAEVIPLLRDETLFETPDPQVEQPLKKAYHQIRELATHCTAARFREVDLQIERVETYLALAARPLSRYSLQP